MEVGELSVFALDLEVHRTAESLARAAADIGDLIFEAVRKHDLRQGFAIPFVDRPGPLEDSNHRQPIEPGIAMMALVDLDRGDGVAMPFVRKRVELAVAAIFAGAVGELATSEFPIGHDSSPAACQAP